MSFEEYTFSCSFFGLLVFPALLLKPNFFILLLLPLPKFIKNIKIKHKDIYTTSFHGYATDTSENPAQGVLLH